MDRIKQRLYSNKMVHKIEILLLMATVVPIVLVGVIASSIWANSVISRTDELMKSRMSTAQKSLDDYFATYDNIIMQIYTENQYASYLETLNVFDRQNYYSVKHTIEKDLQNIAYLYPGMRGIGVYTKKNVLIFCDTRTEMDTESYFFAEDNQQWQEVARATFDYTGTVYSGAVELTDEQGGKEHVMYLAHRLVDMNNYSRGTKGCIIICLSEESVRQVYSTEEDPDSQLSFLCDRKGNIVSCSSPEYIGMQLWAEEEAPASAELESVIKSAVTAHGMMKTSNCLVYLRDVCGSDFIQVSIQDRDALLADVRYIIGIVVFVGIMTAFICALVSFRFAHQIENSMQKIISAMDRAYGGDYSVRIEPGESYEEFAKISRHFNYMVKQIEVSGQQEKEALMREKNAEITALEAQLNPHFLYNTLDAINWIAIENDQFQISKMLKDLAVILRYSIQNSNSMVTMENEIEYLKKYILLQQIRFEYSFKCLLNIDPDVMQCRLHKLLFQPLIENAIIHGFPGKTDSDTIRVQAYAEEGGKLVIRVRDNGKGMPGELVEELNRFDYKNNSVKSSIGIRNVFMRVKYYYGENGDFRIESDENGTIVTLWIEHQ